jgi:hypothetical protein
MHVADASQGLRAEPLPTIPGVPATILRPRKQTSMLMIFETHFFGRVRQFKSVGWLAKVSPGHPDADF